jgi:hypothetical protein
MLYLVTCSIERFDARFQDLDAATLYCECVTRRYGSIPSPLYAVISGNFEGATPIYKYLRGCSI